MRVVTERLILREYTFSDVEAEYQYNTDPELFKYMPFIPGTLKNTRKRIEQTIEKQNQNPRTDYSVAVTVKATKELIGGCRLNKVSDIEGHIGFKLARDHWGKGYATEVGLALVDYRFNVLNLHRVYATVHPENAASIRVLEKVGMRQEARLSARGFILDPHHNSRWYRIEPYPVWRYLPILSPFYLYNDSPEPIRG